MKKSLPVIGCALLLLGLWLIFKCEASIDTSVAPVTPAIPVKPTADIDIGPIHIHPRPGSDIPAPPVPDDDVCSKIQYTPTAANPVAPKADPDDSTDEQPCPCVNGNCPKKSIDVTVKTDNVAVDVKSEQPTQKYQTYRVRKKLFR
jgi:hypothetical protein